MEDKHPEDWFQPQLHLLTRRIVAVDVLSPYWRTGREFLQLRHAGMSIAGGSPPWEVTARIVAPCIRAIQALKQNGHQHIATCINVSWDWVSHRHNVEDAISALHASGSPPYNIVVRIDDDVKLADPSQTARNLQKLKRYGLSVEIDAFAPVIHGTEHLRHMPIDSARIDESLFEKYKGDVRGSVILESFIEMLHKLGIQVTVEGVSTGDDLKLACRLKADIAQGSFIATPMHLDRLTSSLNTRNRLTVADALRP
ncbi:EAL domain-containing protein (putative c-di-GMP-specific phosphodiesterase class I) [Luteibacter rhizovicinus]|uniref:EAL domain-containing protein (Putative c-di-GMP-specific phosphodiesterase class I) n=1 Tax=Luteibacter rhizovicinus TaxID=242606 RepID=A0A4R3YYN8_9GAMM|nr:EAL domain-containing protein [Luteibacter rhizovicinus]TCV97672.1 EAL domain-containing protein (putative c-di-GMP-specific phosphodiesterase class I) [Luteibacter rhizovicinus]